LERQGWVRREPDARYNKAILTPSGLDKVVASAPGHVRTVRELVLDPLGTAAVRDLHELGQRVVRIVDPCQGFPDAP
jgi:hypothetical protein